MQDTFNKLLESIQHLQTLHSIFIVKNNFNKIIDYQLYQSNNKKLSQIINDVGFNEEIYGKRGRQMILADLIEYIFLGRGYYFATNDKKKVNDLLRIILYLVNILMCYESITVENNLRKKFLVKLQHNIKTIKDEELFDSLKKFKGKVGLPEKDTDAKKSLNKYFDTMLPKTAGGLWHELLVYAFLIRYNLGYIIPLLLSQRLFFGNCTLAPPDFLLIAEDKHIYGIEVGMKKEIQSGSFSLITGIPTATIDTINSRSSDRCPICKKWIMFCDFVVENFSNMDGRIEKPEIKCLTKCNKFKRGEILKGKCPYTKYSRNKASTLKHTHHKYSDGLHYHYQCILKKLPKSKVKLLRKSNDITALKTHYPYYSGLEVLFRK